MKLEGLLKHENYTLLKGSLEINIKDIVNHSGSASEGSMFIAIEGFKSDGHQYIQDAIRRGAHCIVIQKEVPISEEVTVIKVENTRHTLAVFADVYYNHPTRNLYLTGVTGTNGKTSTVFLLNGILESLGKKTGIIGTIENRIGSRVLDAARTTPESIELQALFSEMVKENVSHAIMEVSSHALELNRVDNCLFDVGVFTNLSQDHLDFHPSMEAYRDAKLKLFLMAKTGVINIDDADGRYIYENSRCENYLTYGLNNPRADLNAVNVINEISGAKFDLIYQEKSTKISLLTPGKFSVYNALGAIGAALALGIDLDIIKEALAEKSLIRGRFETVKSPEDFYAIVDYAHTPDGLENVLSTIEEFAEGRIITVFGCGGDRDKTKRPLMAKAVGQRSDYAIITSDNPRTEGPEAIIKEAEAGLKETEWLYETVVDRKEAITKALTMAGKNDIILVAGKGHEDYQIIGTTKIHFDDMEIILDIFNKR